MLTLHSIIVDKYQAAGAVMSNDSFQWSPGNPLRSILSFRIDNHGSSTSSNSRRTQGRWHWRIQWGNCRGVVERVPSPSLCWEWHSCWFVSFIKNDMFKMLVSNFLDLSFLFLIFSFFSWKIMREREMGMQDTGGTKSTSGGTALAKANQTSGGKTPLSQRKPSAADRIGINRGPR